MPDQPLEDLFARLERERQDADRAYNDALTALDRAIQSPPTLPDAPRPLDGAGLPSGDGGVTNEVVPLSRIVLGGLRSMIWRIIGSPPGMEQRLHANLAQYANRIGAAHLELRHTVAVLRDAVGDEFNALSRFESLLVQYLQTITLYVDTKNRSMGGSELRDRLALVEQRLMIFKRELAARAEPTPQPTAPAILRSPDQPQPPDVFAGRIDSTTYVGFEDRFRGSRSEIRRRVEDYLPVLEHATNVVDVGCGRGELLGLLQANGITARGVDANHTMVELCRARGLEVERSDALTYIGQQADGSIGGLVAIQVVEHFEPGYLVRFLETAYHKMKPGAPLILETINPVCWMAFFETYIRDLTHQRPLHPDTLSFLVESSGFSAVDVQYRSPVTEGDRLERVPLRASDVAAGSAGGDVPEAGPLAQLASVLNAHADKLNARLFSSMDYAVIARR